MPCLGEVGGGASEGCWWLPGVGDHKGRPYRDGYAVLTGRLVAQPPM